MTPPATYGTWRIAELERHVYGFPQGKPIHYWAPLAEPWHVEIQRPARTVARLAAAKRARGASWG